MSGAEVSSFACHRCGACCTGLRERAAAHGFAELALGIYRQPGEGGLRVFAWEAQVFPADQLAPLHVVADRSRGQRLVLAYELQADTCPNLDEATDRCTVYDERPLVCRAFPLVVDEGDTGPELAASAICQARVPLPENPEPAQLSRVYPQAFAPALAVPRLWRWLVRLVGFLDEADVVDPAGGLDADELAGFDPAVPVSQRLADEDVMEPGELAEQAREQIAAVRALADEQG